MAKKSSILIGIVLLFFVFFALLILVVGVFVLKDRLPRFGRAIAIVEISGPLYDTRLQQELMAKYIENKNIKGIVLRMDSPGGTVSASQELYASVKQARKAGKQVVVSMGNSAASGAYYVACAADVIVANPGSITGSIGVIFNLLNWEELMGKVGLKHDLVKSGKFKDLGSPNRPMTLEERELLEGLIDNVYEQFYRVVAENRSDEIDKALLENIDQVRKVLTPSDLKNVSLETMDSEALLRLVADGRIFSGEQAYQIGLVDSLGTLDDAIEITKKRCGIRGKPRIVRYKEKSSFRDLLSGKVRSIFNAIQRDDFLIEYRYVP